MNNQVNKLPQKKTQTLYHFKNTIKSAFWVFETTTTTSQGDPSNTCTTVATTTHFN